VVLRTGENVFEVPANAGFRSGEGWAVFVVEGGRAVRREVKVGQRSALEAEMPDGLKEGDTVIRYPGNEIAEGTSVAVRQLASTATHKFRYVRTDPHHRSLCRSSSP